MLKHCLILTFSAALFTSAIATADPSTPAWLLKDLQRNARWLPKVIRQEGIHTAAATRMQNLPIDIQYTLVDRAIPPWMIALIPNDEASREEIEKQLRFMADLAGPVSDSALGRRAEELLIFAGAAQLPTPGDKTSGASLGAEGCTAALSKYILAQLKVEFPDQMSWLPAFMTVTQSSAEMARFFRGLPQNTGLPIEVKRHRFHELDVTDVQPGSLMIAQKPGGTHTLAWTRVPRGWGWSEGAMMAVANTGLPQFGSRMILAQEYMTDTPDLPGEMDHNQHGPLNGRQMIMRRGVPVLEDPRTNVYATKGADFIVISFK